MGVPVLATRRFDGEDQRRFARLSGDFNPMHMDAVAARRTQAGAPVVHGMHAVLWALDWLIGAGLVDGPVGSLKVQFQKFIYVDQALSLSVSRRDAAGLRASLTAGGLSLATLAVGLGSLAAGERAGCPGPEVPLDAPSVLGLPDLPGRSGVVPGIADGAAAGAFPHACERLGSIRVGALARLSALVGMVCPGLHSIFGGVSVRFVEAEEAGIGFAVGDVDGRFRRVEIGLSGGGIEGSLVAFLRHPPVAQPRLTALRGLVAPGEFRDVTALVIGGSRGLGALTARLLAAGGARVALTYAVGRAEAVAVASEITAAFGDGACRVLRYDAREDAAQGLAGLDWEINQLYYFATAQIFRQKAKLYEPGLFAAFCGIYVDGFEAACAACAPREGGRLAVFYPSSIAVEDHPREMTEYSMAKAAGELLCGDLRRFMRGVEIIVHRLPRLLTDQTATVTPVRNGDPVEVMLPLVREMRALSPVR